MQIFDVWAIEHFPFLAENWNDSKTVEALRNTCHKVDPYIDVDVILESIADMGVSLYGNDPRSGKSAIDGFKAYLQYGFEIAYYEIHMDDLLADESNHVTG